MSPAEQVVERAPGGVLSYRDDGRIVLANPELHRMLGAEPGSLIGRTFESLLAPASRVYHSTQLSPLLRLHGSWDEAYLQLRKPSGEYVDVLACASRDNAQAMNHGLLMPMSRRKQLEAALIEARKTAESATLAKDHFLAVVSHELRSPLSAILGWVRVGQSERADEGMRRQAFEVIERSAQAQARLIDDLLDISRIVSGKMRLSPRAVDLAPVIEAAIDTAKPAAQAKHITLIPSVDRVPHIVLADPDRIQQVAWNLLTNAIKFTPKGGSVQITLVRVHSSLQLCVSDTGAGIAGEQLPFVFERFWQAGVHNSAAKEGLGLGLAICKSLVELHGGSIRAQSSGVGQGTSFTVELPLSLTGHQPLGQSHHDTRSTDPNPLESSLQGLDLLVVDDDADTRVLMDLLLRTAGASVRLVSGCDEALQALKERVPQVLLTDIGLAGRDGFDLIRHIRSGDIPGTRGLPAIAITGLARPQDRVALLRAGFQAHLSKPIEPAELTALISAVAMKRQ